MAINGRRVILGGLLAGVVSLIGTAADGGVEALLFPVDFQVSLGGGDTQMLGAMALYGPVAFVGGLLSIWLYAAVLSPRFGRGFRTAVVLGVVVWFPFNLLPAVAVGLGWVEPPYVISTRMLVFSAIWQLFQVPISVIAGVWLYEKGRLAPNGP